MRAFLVLMVALLVLSACTGPKEPTGPQPLTGTEGVVLQNTYAPKDVFPQESFELTYEIENRGITAVSSLNPGMVFLNWDSLYLLSDGTLSDFDGQHFWLAPRTQYGPGESSFLTWYFTAKELQRNSAQVETDVRLTICYPYQTNVTQQVCIERERDVDPSAVACSDRVLRPATPGAPIGVHSVETRSARVQTGYEEVGVVPQFRILLENYGDGIPATGTCGSNEGLNTVSARVFLLDEELDCGDLPVTFTRGQAYLACTAPDDYTITRGEGNFASLLTVLLDYTYREGETATVVIRND